MMSEQTGKKIMVGLSGGVDSSVAAWLLKQQGYEVYGVTMLAWREKEEPKFGPDGLIVRPETTDARHVAEALDIPYSVIDYRSEFRKEIVDYFTREYLAGRTPNPCVFCNRKIKWQSLLAAAARVGADTVATGHYASVELLPNGRRTLKSAAEKDQTYALYRLSQEQLAHTVLPLGGMQSKEEVRKLAAEAGIPVAEKPDSQEVCFIPEGDYASFIARVTGHTSLPGNFVDKTGKVLGRHSGIIHYTVGQRKGLGIAFGEPAFVLELRPETNEVVLGFGDEILSSALTADNLNWMSVADAPQEMQVTAKIRYNHRGAKAVLCRDGEDRVRVEFEEPQRAVTPGQAVVFYDGDLLVGGGTIRRA